jgi:Fe-S-cluster-containing dehydrogenase component
MVRYGMVIDVTKCSGCYDCFLACKDEFCGHDYPGYSAAQPMTGHFWMNLIEKERGQFPRVKVAYIPVPCMHCQEATCIKMASDGAVYRRPDGIVIIDPEKAKGQKQLVSACPYRVIFWNEEKGLPQKCNLCAHLLDEGWKEPRCVEVCPTGALVFGDLDDANSEVSQLIASGAAAPIHPEYGLKESVTYIGLPKVFVAGTVVFGDTDECAEKVNVMLAGQGSQQTTRTNNYGDFEFEGLEPDTEYRLKIEYDGYVPQESTVRTWTDVYLGEITLSPASR